MNRQLTTVRTAVSPIEELKQYRGPVASLYHSVRTAVSPIEELKRMQQY